MRQNRVIHVSSKSLSGDPIELAALISRNGPGARREVDMNHSSRPLTSRLNTRLILNMRSTSDDSNSQKQNAAQKPSPAGAKPNRAPNSSPETAETIRTAAIKEFAEHGLTKTTIRNIASAAGVSPGLVIHHFGSKDGMRTACDDYVFAAITEAKAKNADYATRAVSMMFNDPSMRANIEYLMKSLLDPSDHGRRHFEQYVNLVEDYLAHGFAGYTFRPSDDPKGQAATMAVLALAPSILGHRLQETLGTNTTEETMTRLAPHLLDLYLNGVLTTTPTDTSPTDTTRGPTNPTHTP